MSQNVQFQTIIDDPYFWQNVLQFEVVRRKLGREDIIAPLASQMTKELEFTSQSAWGEQKMDRFQFLGHLRGVSSDVQR